jgi:hypothetical protein
MEEWKFLKTLSESSPIFALSFHTTFSQIQTGATVPLMGTYAKLGTRSDEAMKR